MANQSDPDDFGLPPDPPFESLASGWVPEDASIPVALLGFAVYFLLAYGILRFFEWRRWYLRL